MPTFLERAAHSDNRLFSLYYDYLLFWLFLILDLGQKIGLDYTRSWSWLTFYLTKKNCLVARLISMNIIMPLFCKKHVKIRN